MPRDQTFVILGASLAGAKAAETLREERVLGGEVGAIYRDIHTYHNGIVAPARRRRLDLA